MDSIVLFLKEDILPEGKSVDKVRRKASRFWLFKDQKLYKHLFLGHTHYAYTLKHQRYSKRSYMKGFVEATQEADPCPTEPSFRDIGGRTYRRKHKSM